jgi:molybdopterin-containing oxidoreductase family membrane subunit
VSTGIGTWGQNSWLGLGYHKLCLVGGIGHAGTLISAVLLLFRQRWRMAINRSAEAMTIFQLFKLVYFQLFTWVVHG